MPPNTEEDKVRGLSPYDFKRLLIALLGNADIPGVKLLGKKSDDTFENIKSDDAGRLQVYDPKVGSLISYSGTTTTDGAVDGSTLIDSVLTTKPDFNGNLVIITSGDYAGQARDINGVTTAGTVTPSSAFGGQIVEGTSFVIAALRLTPAEVAAIEAKLDNPDYGLATIGHILDSHTISYTGHIYYVDGTDGDDADDGGIHDPFKTIAHAISVAAPGDRIKVRAGVYDEALNMNLAGLELVCEQGTILSNSTPGTVLVVSANYCRAVGAILAQAGQTGLQITGNFASIEDCLAFGCATGFDDNGLETHLKNCRSILHTTTGFDISAGYGQYERLVATSTGAVRGIYLSGVAADHNHFFDCHTLGNTTAGWEIIAGANNNMSSHCSTGAGDGAKVDNGTNNTWDDFTEGSQIVAGQSRDQDLKDIYDALAAAEVKLDNLGAFTAIDNLKAILGAYTATANLKAAIDRTLFCMDFWSDPQEEVQLTTTAEDKALPNVGIADLPDTATIVRAVAMFKFRMVENTNADNPNNLVLDQYIQVKKSGQSFNNAIKMINTGFTIAAATREGGDVIIGNIDLAGTNKVDANATYECQWTTADVAQNNLQFNDVQVGLRIWYSV